MRPRIFAQGNTHRRTLGLKAETEEEDTMKKSDQANLGTQAKWVIGALGIVLAYFGAFVRRF